MRDGVKMKRMEKIIRYLKRTKVIVLSLLFSLKLYSEVPVEITYQGNIREKGILISGVRNMSFSIYDSTSSTTPLWESTTTAVSISTGVFRVSLKPEIPRDKWNDVLYLEITVEGQKLTPREKITPSPSAINSLLHEGKRYYTSILPPSDVQGGDLWFNPNTGSLYYYNGSGWTTPSGGVPAPHHTTHEPGGGDEITKLGEITFMDDIIISSNTLIRAGVNVSSITVSTNVNIGGWLNVSSSVYANWLYGNGSGITNIKGENIVDNSILPSKLAPCSANQILFYNGTQWICISPSAGSETDPWSIHNYNLTSSSQTASLYITSSTVEYSYVLTKLVSYKVSELNPANNGLFVTESGMVGIGTSNPLSKLSVVGDAYFGNETSVAIKVDNNAKVGIGISTPKSKLDVVGDDVSGNKISVYYAGDKPIAYFKRK